MGGINFWGGTKEGDIFLAPSFDDKILEVVAVFGSVQMAASRLINLQHHRIAQCQSIQINILGKPNIFILFVSDHIYNIYLIQNLTYNITIFFLLRRRRRTNPSRR